jgi:hypothetical protein
MKPITLAVATAVLAVVGGTAGMAFADSAAAPGKLPDFHLVGNPRLYVVTPVPAGGGPVVYVVFRSSVHLHEPRQVLAQVKGVSGRTFASRRTGVPNCYRSVSLYSASPRSPKLTPGRKYRVSFLLRRSAYTRRTTPATSVTVVARRLAPSGGGPSC